MTLSVITGGESGMKVAGKNHERFMEQMLPKQNHKLLLGDSQQNTCVFQYMSDERKPSWNSTSNLLRSLGGNCTKKKILGYKTEPRRPLVLQWNMDQGVPPIYIWKSMHKPGIGISMVNEKASHSSFPRPATFSVPSPCTGENNPGSELLWEPAFFKLCQENMK